MLRPVLLFHPWLRRWCIRLWGAFFSLYLLLVGSYLTRPTEINATTNTTTDARFSALVIFLLFGFLLATSGGLLWVWNRTTRDIFAFPSPSEHPLRYAYILREIMPRALCEQIITTAEQSPWTHARHAQATQDQPLRTLPTLRGTLESFLLESAFPHVSAKYAIPLAALRIKEAFVVRYDTTHQSKLDLHRDASLLTLSIALNDQHAYHGGGTFFPCIGTLCALPQAGDMLLHCGKIQHGGYPIRDGVRYLLVCFIDCTRDPRFDHDEIARWDSGSPDDYEVMHRLSYTPSA